MKKLLGFSLLPFILSGIFITHSTLDKDLDEFAGIANVQIIEVAGSVGATYKRPMMYNPSTMEFCCKNTGQTNCSASAKCD